MLEGSLKEVPNMGIIQSVVDVATCLAVSHELLVSEDSQLVGNR